MCEWIILVSYLLAKQPKITLAVANFERIGCFLYIKPVRMRKANALMRYNFVDSMQFLRLLNVAYLIKELLC